MTTDDRIPARPWNGGRVETSRRRASVGAIKSSSALGAGGALNAAIDADRQPLVDSEGDAKVPGWLRRDVAQRRYKFRNDTDKIAVMIALMFPKGLTPRHGELSYFCEAALSCCDGDRARTAVAVERLFRGGFTIPADIITDRRAARAEADRLIRQLGPSLALSIAESRAP